MLIFERECTSNAQCGSRDLGLRTGTFTPNRRCGLLA